VENEQSIEASLEDRPVNIIVNKYFKNSITSINFQHHVFRDTGAKKLVFKNCDFSFCLLERAYFHACEFIDCKFIGARFVDCNFRNARFEGCQFEYSIFKSTLISHHQILKNLSPWPNVRRELLRTLRINAESIGDAEAVKEYVREELSASREHLKKARDGKESYYAKKYKGFHAKLTIYGHSIWSWFDWHLWGHGEYPAKILRTIIIILIFSTLHLLFNDQTFSVNLTISNIISLSMKYFLESAFVFVGVIPDEFPDIVAALLSLTRYVSLGLFISVLYKRLARR